MKVTVRVNNKTNLEFGFKERCEEKFKKFDKYFKEPNEIEARVLCKEHNESKTIEVTIPTKNIILRAEVKADTFNNALDNALEKLESQIRKHKSKIYSSMKHREGVAGYYASQGELNVDNTVEEEDESKLVKVKNIKLVPMSVDDAILQMNMLGHNFFLFLNNENKKVSIVYLRNDKDYGIIEAEM